MRSFAISEHLRGQRDDLHELLVTQLAADRAEDAGPARVAVVAEDDRGVLVEADVGAVRTPALLHRAHDGRLDDVTLVDVPAGDRVLDRGHDDVADAGVAAAGTAEHPDAQDLLGTRVVGDPKPRLLLDHFRTPSSRRFSGGALRNSMWTRPAPGAGRFGRGAYLARSRISTTRQRLVADSGRVSLMRTRSPMPAALPSSCALTLLERRSTLPYSGCLTRSSTSTTTVLSILSLTT